MSKKKLIAICLCIFATIVLNIFIFKTVRLETSVNQQIIFGVELQSDLVDDYQLYYSSEEVFNEEQSERFAYDKTNIKEKIEYTVTLQDKYLRLDLGNSAGDVIIYDFYYKSLFGTVELGLSLFDNMISANGIVNLERKDDSVEIKTEGNDPYLLFVMDNEAVLKDMKKTEDKVSLIIDIIFCIIIDLVVLYGLKHLRKLVSLPMEIYRDRNLAWNLSKNDFKTKFVGSYLGVIWAFIQPVVTVIVYWFVFEIGLRAGRMCDYPFILWLMAGLVPWFFFSEALNGATNALVEYNYLVKKVVFKIEILPVVKVMSSIFVHLFFVSFMIIMCWIYGYAPDLYSFQLIYYIFCTFILVLGLSYITSAVVGFFKDLIQIINIGLQVGMWVTPIMWDSTTVLSPGLQVIFKLNPMYYIVDGFRDAMLGKVWFWDKPIWTCYFWTLVVLIFGIGILIFRKLRVHFADVL